MESDSDNTSIPKLCTPAGSKSYRPGGPCDGPGCESTVPAGMFPNRQVYYFCSKECKGRHKNERRKAYVKVAIGTCLRCDGPIRFRSQKKRKDPKYCTENCYRMAREERIMVPTGPFRAEIDAYITECAHYSVTTLPGVKTHLAGFFRFANKLGLSCLEAINPSHISTFILEEKARGLRSLNVIGHLSTYFDWHIQVKRREDIRNPVIRKFHRQTYTAKDPRPLTDDEVDLLWDLLVASGDIRLMLVFAIGLECGLRGGEICNIRISDVYTASRKIHVRLPTKNGTEREVPYHNRVELCLGLWQALRNENCGHDHLIHGVRNAPWTIRSLDQFFQKFFQQFPDLATKFTSHRLRHTWATRLFNNGMDLAVLQKLGGWACLASMESYIRILPETIRSQYEEAYERMKNSQQEPAPETLSMDQFLQLDIDQI